MLPIGRKGLREESERSFGIWSGHLLPKYRLLLVSEAVASRIHALLADAHDIDIIMLLPLATCAVFSRIG